ncbi:MAG: ATP-binding cassette domain-containing protein [Chthoniobacter sp.]|uniref:ATP-binding cassette domain-containing protein n=1 Tax=Chthoniobacter sp. TaxID=2510640 RepID=UPI0032A71C36
MLELKEVSLQLGNAPDDQLLLSELTVRFPKKHFAAILGPSGCGKSTLLKVIAGLREPSLGHVSWEGRDLSEDGDMDPHEIGYVPQFSIAYDLLTVWESVESTLRLRVSGLSREEQEARLEQILREVGLEEIADRQVKVLSGGQKRRLALALEMVSSPHLLLCDEVTSGLDPKAEDEIANLMHQIAQRDDRIVLSVTHSLRHVDLYDSVVVLYQGHLAYHGPATALFHYFDVAKPEELFPRLAQRKPTDWHRSWQKHRSSYGIDSLRDDADEVALEEVSDVPASGEDTEERFQQLLKKARFDEEEPEKDQAGVETQKVSDEKLEVETRRKLDYPGTPGALSQFSVLLARRWKIFFRDRGQLWLQLALLFGFPILVVIFALDGLPQIKNLNGVISGNFLEQMKNEFQQRQELVHTGSLVSGLIMFQVILLALMGSNNAAREIAGERLIFEKEKFAGVRPSAYVASKAAYLGVLVLAQSIWMGVFVNYVVQFKGNPATQVMLLIFVNAALTAICLAISSLMKTAEQASLVSIYLVGFQLPLSGAVLALPKALSWLTRPFIASYWGWSGFIQTMHDTRFYEAVLSVTQTTLVPADLCFWVLMTHVLLGLLIAYMGCKNSQWE